MRFFIFLLLLNAPRAWSAHVTLSTVSFDVPDAVAAGNKVLVTTDGISTYAWNRLRADSSSYYYSYSFKLDNVLFEFRECHKVDIYEAFETYFKPSLAKSKELKNFEITRFQSTSNEFLRSSFSNAVVEYDKGMRKLTLLYTINQTGLFLVSIKSKYPAETFLKAQNNLDSILVTAQYTQAVVPQHETVIQKGELVNRTHHTTIKLPYYLATDFNNPVVQATPDNGFVVVFAHAEGSEIFKLNAENKITATAHHDKIIHDIAISEKGFFSLSSTDYNMLSYGIYPSLYLNKHNQNGGVELSQVVFKQNDVKLPGNQVFDYYSRDNVCLEIADTFGIIYMNSEKRFKDLKVLQSGAYKTFSLENGILKKGNEDLYHLSHCFAQASTHDSKFAYLVSLSDGIPRGVCLSKVDIAIAKDSTDTTSFYHHVLFEIDGTPGDNYVADTHFSEPLLYNNFLYVIIETEQGARTDLESNELSANRGHNDLFLVKCSLDSKEMIVKQLTKTDKIEEVNPKLVDLGNELLLIYSEARFDKQTSRYSFADKYLLLDERGGRQSILEEFNSFYDNEKRADYKMPDGPVNRDGSNLVKMADGSVIWVRLLKNAQEIEVIRFK
ncbi:MAG: hypothetical protein HYZ14_01005 [Bacteroidetes bacterium]|nr:hypothetical protein [Bacteroidota bacterium]